MLFRSPCAQHCFQPLEVMVDGFLGSMGISLLFYFPSTSSPKSPSFALHNRSLLQRKQSTRKLCSKNSHPPRSASLFPVTLSRPRHQKTGQIIRAKRRARGPPHGWLPKSARTDRFSCTTHSIRLALVSTLKSFFCQTYTQNKKLS